MKHIWFISNARSGSTSEDKCEALRTICTDKGLHIVGHSQFPDDDLPGPDALQRAGADTVLLFAGDGTINATIRAIGTWEGQVLILPGGTMNLLAKMLHGDADPAEIIHKAHNATRLTGLSYLHADDHRAYVAVILGPAAYWARAREAARQRKGINMARHAMDAWRRMFSEKIRVAGVPGLSHGYQAIFATSRQGEISLAAVNAHDWRSIAQLGWDWLRGDWVAAQAVTSRQTDSFRIASRHSVLALFDGEPQTLSRGTGFTAGQSAPIFLTTLAEDP